MIELLKEYGLRKPMVWMLFEYESKQYSVVSPYLWKEYGEIRFPEEWDGARNCGHDYSSTIRMMYPGFPNIEVCDPNPIKLLKYHILNEDLLIDER